MKKKTVIIILAFFLVIAAAIFLATSLAGKRGATARKIKTVSGHFSVFTPGEEASPEKPNIILIVVESLRADHVSSDGYFRATTPQIDNFAQSAFRFTNCVSASSWTVPSHMSMLTGLYPGAHNVISLNLRLSEKIITFAQVLKHNGYNTVGFVTNPVLNARSGFGQGFNFYDDFTVDLDVDDNFFANQAEDINVRRESRTSPALNRAVLGWLKRNYNQKFFLFVHYFDTHYDYIPQPPYDTLFDPGYKGKYDGRGIQGLPPNIPKRDLEHIVSLYDGEIRWTDEHVGAVLKELENLGIKETTLIIVVGDHGEEFLEHGKTGHGNSLYNELIRVPLVIKLPGASRKPAVINALASDVDFIPTVCDYLKINVPEGAQGKSFLPEMNGEKGKERPYVFSELTRLEDDGVTLRAIIGNGFKFIANFANGEKELYNLKEDPGDKYNLIEKEPQKAALLEKELRDFISSSDKLSLTLKGSGNNTVVLDEETKKKFKALGYLQ